ncbi:hypothetical protein A8950_2566 [Dongia mobilis]|uniref:Uncharacterized protein n=1 Tax=Dongia mobilis TaxID=578943 RepID=A0A4R6WW48_9PROT|nr:hypothetical protein [Dongia mobilis]TDQ81498.1 hypothetical protein A8950_2566 [Dongia mobilis]
MINENYNDLLREIGHARHSAAAAWRLIAVLALLLVGLSTALHLA